MRRARSRAAGRPAAGPPRRRRDARAPRVLVHDRGAGTRTLADDDPQARQLLAAARALLDATARAGRRG